MIGLQSISKLKIKVRKKRKSRIIAITNPKECEAQ
jgi:hypothetical protein